MGDHLLALDKISCFQLTSRILVAVVVPVAPSRSIPITKFMLLILLCVVDSPVFVDAR